MRNTNLSFVILVFSQHNFCLAVASTAKTSKRLNLPKETPIIKISHFSSRTTRAILWTILECHVVFRVAGPRVGPQAEPPPTEVLHFNAAAADNSNLSDCFWSWKNPKLTTVSQIA